MKKNVTASSRKKLCIYQVKLLPKVNENKHKHNSFPVVFLQWNKPRLRLEEKCKFEAVNIVRPIIKHSTKTRTYSDLLYELLHCTMHEFFFCQTFPFKLQK